MNESNLNFKSKAYGRPKPWLRRKYKAHQRAVAQICLSLCEKAVMEGVSDEKDGALACCAAIAAEFGLEGK